MVVFHCDLRIRYRELGIKMSSCFFSSEKEDVDRETPSSTVNMEYLDQLGMATLESEEVCHNLIGELNRQLEGSPDDPLFLWRLSRGLVHLSMHCEQKGELEEEKQLLIKGSVLSRGTVVCGEN